MIEFVSANPTGPLHVAHGRHAAYGATLANLLSATGHRVHREYYVNDAGRQMDILGGEHLDALSATVWRGAAVSRRTATAATTCGRSPPSAAGQRRRSAAAARRERDGGAAGRCSRAGDKELHIDALIARCRELIGEEGFQDVLGLSLDLMIARHPR